MARKNSGNHGLKVASWVVLGLLLLVAAASLLPLVETDAWWIRFLDFPRLQLAAAMVVLLVVFLLMSRGWAARVLTVVAAVAALSYHAWKLHPYFEATSDRMAGTFESCPEGDGLSVLVANVQARNERSQEFLSLVADTDPDLLLVLETDPWWDRHLTTLRDSFPHAVQHVSEEHGPFGMHLLSKLELVQPEIRFLFDAFTPSIFTNVALPGGQQVRFLGLHPRPPQAWSQPTTMRDAHLLTAALDARSSPAPTILAGDFNAVPWERVNRRAMRIGSLLDPRVGRGLYPTFSTGNPVISWPLDQVLFQNELVLTRFDKLPAFGSDHFPVIASLCLAPEASLVQSAPKAAPDDLEEAAATIQAAEAMQNVEARGQ